MILENPHYAGLWPRFLALAVDLLLFCTAFFPITRIVKGVWLMSPNDHRWSFGLFITDPLCMIFLVVMFLYFVLLEGMVGATLGKLEIAFMIQPTMAYFRTNTVGECLRLTNQMKKEYLNF